jgi:hypothetical protein
MAAPVDAQTSRRWRDIVRRRLGMKLRLRTALTLAIAVAALVAQPSAAAMDIAVSVSPSTGIVDRPVEVLVRTFAPVGGDAIDLPRPSQAYPTPSGLWDVLYPVDYPFDVVARSPTGEEVKVALVRDDADASLWRGTFTPTAPGAWSIVMRNFPALSPTPLNVAAGESTFGEWGIAIAGLMLGFVGGLVLARAMRR